MTAILGHIGWGDSTGTTVCKISVRRIEAVNRHTDSPAVRASTGAATGPREVKMKVDLQMASGILKSYHLGCLGGMGSSRQVQQMKRLKHDRHDGAYGTSITMGIRLLRSVVLDTIDPRAEDFSLLVRDSSIVLRGLTSIIKDEHGNVLNRPRNTTIKIPLMKFVRCSAIKGTQVQFSLKPLRVFAGLAAALGIPSSHSTFNNKSGERGAERSETDGSFEAMANSEAGRLDASASYIELLVNDLGTRTRFQSLTPRVHGSNNSSSDSGTFQYTFEFISKSNNEDQQSEETQSTRKKKRKEHHTGATEHEAKAAMAAAGKVRNDNDDDDSLARHEERVEHDTDLFVGTQYSDDEQQKQQQEQVTKGHHDGSGGSGSSDDNGDDDDEEFNANRSFGKLIGRSVRQKSVEPEEGTMDYYVTQSQQRRRDRREHIRKFNQRVGGADAVDDENENANVNNDYLGGPYSRHGGNHHQHVNLLDEEEPVSASVGWMTQDEPGNERTGDDDYDLQDENEEEFDDDIQELRSTQFLAVKGGLILDELTNEVGPTQGVANTRMKGLFD